MKRFIAILLILVTSILAVSCGTEEAFEVRRNEKAYHDLGLHFKLPKDFEQKRPYEEDHIQRYYSNGKAGFFFNAFSADMLVNQHGLAADITVEEYTRGFLIRNYQELVYDYDAERDRATFYYIISYDDDESEAERYMYLVMRGTAHLYVITMFCDEAVYPEYKDFFEELTEIMYVD